MDSNRSAFIQWFIVLVTSIVTGWFFVQQGPGKITALFGAILLTIALFRVKESYLPLLLILILTLGSSYRWDVVEKTFYLRFFVLGVIALRGFFSILTHSRSGGSSSASTFVWFHWLISLFALWGLVSSLISVAMFTSLLRAISFLLMVYVIFVYFWKQTDSPQKCREFGLTLQRSLLIILSVGFLFLVIGVPGMFKGGRLRLVLMNPNTLGHYVSLLTPIVIWYLFEPSIRKNRFLTWGLAITLGVSLLASGSRAALLAGFLAVVLQLALCYRSKLVVGIVGALLIFSGQFLVGSSDPVMDGDPGFIEENVLREGTLETGSGRKQIWEAAWYLIQKKPYFGYGFATTDILFQRGYFPTVQEFQGGHAHNGYIQELLNLGWVGASPLFICFLILLLSGVQHLIKPRQATLNYRFAVAMYCTIFVGLISGIAESWFTSVGSVFCFPFFLCIMLYLKSVRFFNDWERPAP